jgi:hypothetical protein
MPPGLKSTAMEAPMENDRKSNLKLEGEGSYEGARKYQEAQHDFAQKGPVEAKAREAADAIDGEEGEELERARRQTAARGRVEQADKEGPIE